MLQIEINENPLKAPNIVWDVTPITSAVERLASSRTSPNYFKIIGRDTLDYLAPVALALSPYRPVTITSKAALRGFIGSRILDRQADRYVSHIFERISDWGHDRLNVTVQNGSLWNLDENRLASDILSKEPNSFSSRAYLEDVISAIASAFADQIILIHASIYHEASYFKALFPLIVKRSQNAVWVLFDDHNLLASSAMPSIRREYIRYEEILRIIAHRFDATEESVARLGRTNRANSSGSGSFTQGEFANEYEFLAKAASSADLERLPDIPAPVPSPIHFGIKSEVLYVDLEDVTGIDLPTLGVVTEELSHMIADVTEFHGLSNSAPGTARKLERMKGVLSDIASDDPSTGTVIRYGIMVGALEESIRFDPEGLIENAQGPLRALITQSHIFLNRFDTWRQYLRDSSLIELEGSDESTARRAIEILHCATDESEAVDQDSRATIRRFSAQVGAVDTKSEKVGIFTVLQNLLSIGGNHVKRQLVMSAGLAIDDFKKDGAKWAILKFMLASEIAIRFLATTFPSMFGWLNGFLDWIKSLHS